MNLNEKSTLAQLLKVNLAGKNYVSIPKNIIRIKIDVGLSYDAPHAIHWLKNDDKLFVIGFEPIEENIIKLRDLMKKKENKDINDRFLIVPCALSCTSGSIEMFVTPNKGMSSILKPKTYSIDSTLTVRTETLDNFMNLIDLDSFERIDYIKTDCQGFDLEVLKGAKNTLKHTAIVTCESENFHYINAENSPEHLENFFNEIGFEYVNKVSGRSRIIRKLLSPLMKVIGAKSKVYVKAIEKKHKIPLITGSNVIAIDPTFVNSKYKHLVESGEVTALQFN
jgi:FkbM family methyltransferase